MRIWLDLACKKFDNQAQDVLVLARTNREAVQCYEGQYDLSMI